MAKTRKNKLKDKKGIIIPLPVTFFLITGAALFLVFGCLDSRGRVLGERIKKLESEQRVLNERYNYELARWERMKTARRIEEALVKHNIRMIWPEESRIVRLSHPALRRAEHEVRGEIAQAPVTRGTIY